MNRRVVAYLGGGVLVFALLVGLGLERRKHLLLWGDLELILAGDRAQHALESDAVFAAQAKRYAEHCDQFGSGEKDLLSLAKLYHSNGYNKVAIDLYDVLAKQLGDREEVHYLLALAAGEIGSTEKELLHLEKSVSMKEYWPALVRLGRLYLKQGKLTQAEEVLLRAEQKGRAEPQAAFGLARVAQIRGESERAIAWLEKCLQIDHSFAPAAALLGKLYLKTGDNEKARAFLAQAKTGSPYFEPEDSVLDEMMEHCVRLDRLLVQSDKRLLRGDPGAARRFLERAVSYYPKQPRVWIAQGEVLQRLGEWEAAIASLETALALEPNNAVVVSLLARARHENGDAQQAMELVRERMRDGVSSAGLYRVLGELNRDIGREQLALSNFKDGVALYPNDLKLRSAFARALWEQGFEAPAMEHFEFVARRDGADFHSRAFLAQHFLGDGDLDRAERYAREAHWIDSDHPQVRGLLIDVIRFRSGELLKDGQSKEAIQQLEGAVQLFPTDLHLRFELACLHERIGSLHEAETLAASVLEREPKNEEARRLLERLSDVKEEVDR